MPTSLTAQTGPRVLIVDRDERVRDSLAGMLAIGDRVTVVGTAGDAAEAIIQAAVTHPDVVIVDPRLPEASDCDAFITDLRLHVPGIRVVCMAPTDVLDGAGEVHADAFVRKTFRPSELVTAILAAAGDRSSHPRHPS